MRDIFTGVTSHHGRPARASRWLVLSLLVLGSLAAPLNGEGCPSSQDILPCRCSLRDGKDIQIWCSHSNLPQIMEGIKAVERQVTGRIDELVLENNQLPALPGRFFGTLQIVRLMLRHNSIERVSTGWLNELENSLVEVFIVEPQLRSVPVESLSGMINLLAITIQSEELRHLPDFSGLLSLNYLSVESVALSDLQPHWFRHLPKLQHLQVGGGRDLRRLEAGLFDGLISLKHIDLSRNGIDWAHLRTFSRLTSLQSLKLSHNAIIDAGLVGRIVKDLEGLRKLRLDHNRIAVVKDGSFVDLPQLAELHLNDNSIAEIQYGAFLRVPQLRLIYLHNNHLRRIHPESFLQASGSGVEAVHMYHNEVARVEELRSLLDALPSLKFLDMSNNLLSEIPYGALRGHGTLEQLHLNNNRLRLIEHDAIMAMPALRELRLRNNSLSDDAAMPFWNLPALKGLDLSQNRFREAHAPLLAGLPSLRRLDLSENGLVTLDAAVFMHNPLLETLNISHNQIEVFHPATLRHLDRLFEVDASHNQMREILPGLPKIVERLSVRGNIIRTLPIAASKALHLPNLRMLDLSLNQLEQLPKYGFQGVPQLRVLSLANNKLRSLDDTTFMGVRRLELLHLHENALGHIDERTFLAMPELRNLNLQANQLAHITDNLLANNTRLEQLDLSRNRIRTIAPAAFEAQRSLEYLDLSGNQLADMSVSLSQLASLRDIDLSYNEITHVHADVVSSWSSVVEIRLANNVIAKLDGGTFRNLPKLQYLDLSSNEIGSVETGALKRLPDLQELVLADNKLVELKDHVFEDMPSLLASHFQYNQLRYISPESFHNSPALVFLNLSNNHFRNMDNVGVRAMNNLEVLDLSTNGIRLVSTMPLRNLNWLVELKMDDNEICKIQGSPFETMPRLRVLSMRNNQLRMIKERTFRNLRGNIAILDVDGNPIVCTCEMQWFSVWLQETNFPYPGPKCPDGRLLRSSRMDKELCPSGGADIYESGNQRIGLAGGGGAGHKQQSEGLDPEAANRLPLLNEHGDLFQRELPDEFSEQCDVSFAGERPLPGESEYFYEQYVDYTPSSDTGASSPTAMSATHRPEAATAAADSFTSLNQQKRPPTAVISPNIDLNNTLLHTNYIKQRPGLGLGAGDPSAFTFFGYPLPSLGLGRFFGMGPGGRKDRGEGTAKKKNSSESASNERTVGEQSSAAMPATHRMQHSSRGKTRMYQPNSNEFEKYLKPPPPPPQQQQQQQPPQQEQYGDAMSRVRFFDSESDETGPGATGSDGISGADRPMNVFRTSFRQPSVVERGGFRPIVPGQEGGFVPMADPYRRSATITKQTSESKPIRVAEVVAASETDDETIRTTTERLYIPIATTERVHSSSTPTTAAPVETDTYYVTEMSLEVTTTAGPQQYRHPLKPPPGTATTTGPPPSTSTENRVIPDEEEDKETLTTSTTTTTTTTTTTKTTVQPTMSADHDAEEDPFYDDLEAQSVSIMRPPPLVQTTTAETILLIPPPEEHVESFKRQTWLSSTTSTPAPPLFEGATPRRVTSRTPGGRSTITKVFTPSKNQFQPTAEERSTLDTDESSESSAPEDSAKFPAGLASHESQPVERVDRKDGMDWYYESFNKIRNVAANAPRSGEHVPFGSSLQSEDYTPPNAATAPGRHVWFWLFTWLLHTFITFQPPR